MDKGREVDLGQPLSVLRCFGIKFGYYNPSDWEQARMIDPIVDFWSDIMVSQTKIINSVGVTDD